MKRLKLAGMAVLLVGSCLSFAGTTSAGPYVNVMQPCDCPPTHYSEMHIIMPGLWRWAAWCQGPCRYTFARTLHPEVATTYYVKRYHCPSVNPLQFSLQTYPGLAGTPPASTYQSSQTAQSQSSKSPQDLPPSEETAPGAEKLPPPREEPSKK